MTLGTKCVLGLLMMLVLYEVSLGKIPRKRRSTTFHRFVRGSFDEEQYLPYDVEAEPALSDTEAELKLLEVLHGNYDRRQVNPIERGESLSVGLTYVCARFDEKEHVLTSTVWLQQTWKDPGLQWDPSDYNGITEVRVPSYVLWTPDLQVYNALEREKRDYVKILVESSGKVWSFPPTSFKTACRPQNSNSHLCSIQIGSWTYDSRLLPLKLNSEGFRIEEKSQDCPYIVSNPEVHLENKKYDCCEEVYQTINYTFTIQPNDYSHY